MSKIRLGAVAVAAAIPVFLAATPALAVGVTTPAEGTNGVDGGSGNDCLKVTAASASYDPKTGQQSVTVAKVSTGGVSSCV